MQEEDNRNYLHKPENSKNSKDELSGCKSYSTISGISSSAC